MIVECIDDKSEDPRFEIVAGMAYETNGQYQSRRGDGYFLKGCKYPYLKVRFKVVDVNINELLTECITI